MRDSGEWEQTRLTMTQDLILALESSCDESAVAVVRGGTDVLANEIHSQVALHGPWGGVVPEIAGRSHLDRILPLLERALTTANVDWTEIDAIAVTNRPGLVGCLLVGVSVAKSIALITEKPLLGIDHLQAHVDAAFLDRREPVALPMLALVASGGHTSLYLCEKRGAAARVSRSRDDAAGEALDKAAAMLGLGYPGGPALEKAALTGDATAVRFKRGLLRGETLDVSFSGMKTALLYHLRGPGLERSMPELEDGERADLAASFQEAVVDTLVERVATAQQTLGAQSVSIGGGVARNQRLRDKLSARLENVDLLFPAPAYCSDNAAMIAGLGAIEYAAGRRDGLDLDVAARSS